MAFNTGRKEFMRPFRSQSNVEQVGTKRQQNFPLASTKDWAIDLRLYRFLMAWSLTDGLLTVGRSITLVCISHGPEWTSGPPFLFSFYILYFS